jgi:hypothetical protein
VRWVPRTTGQKKTRTQPQRGIGGFPLRLLPHEPLGGLLPAGGHSDWALREPQPPVSLRGRPPPGGSQARSGAARDTVTIAAPLAVPEVAAAVLDTSEE